MANHPADLRLYQLVLAVVAKFGVDAWQLPELLEARRYLIEKGVWKIPGQEENDL